jgi:hypothetical protein
MNKIFKRALAIFAVLGGALVATATPAMANANTKVLCGYQGITSPAGQKTGIYYVVDMTAKSTNPGLYNDDEYHNKVCDTALDKISAKLATQVTWYKQRKETTWADRCNDSDPVAMFYGKKGNGCVNYVKGTTNYASNGQSTPHDLLSCMVPDHTYKVVYDGKERIYYNNDDAANVKEIGRIPDAQLNCEAPPKI